MPCVHSFVNFYFVACITTEIESREDMSSWTGCFLTFAKSVLLGWHVYLEG